MSEEEKYELARLLQQWFNSYDSLDPSEADTAVLDTVRDIQGEYTHLE